MFFQKAETKIEKEEKKLFARGPLTMQNISYIYWRRIVHIFDRDSNKRPKKQNPERSKSRMLKIPNAQNPEYSKSRKTQNPERSKSRILKIPNTQNFSQKLIKPQTVVDFFKKRN
jgi:hypothetical protein